MSRLSINELLEGFACAPPDVLLVCDVDGPCSSISAMPDSSSDIYVPQRGCKITPFSD
jgi:hypothetical protein